MLSFTPQAHALVLQFGNVALLLAAMALICCCTTDTKVTKYYLFAVALADFGHIYSVYQATGSEYFWQPSDWNSMTWGNVGCSAFLNLHRWLTLLGVFGKLSTVSRDKKTT